MLNNSDPFIFYLLIKGIYCYKSNYIIKNKKVLMAIANSLYIYNSETKE